jgi:AcrR family transcriptional regulator
MKKDLIYQALMATGRQLVQEKGVDFLTARKLSDASGYSVGTIYNQFSNMDKFILAQNMQTLDDLYAKLLKIIPDNDSYKNLNRYLDGFVTYVLSNQNLWFLLYNFHLNAKNPKLPTAYLKKLIRATSLWQPHFDVVFKKLSKKEKNLAKQVLWLSIFSVSSFLTTQTLDGFGKINKKNICKLLLNTYLAGLTTLKR